ncbi:MAG: hypothetical protein Q4D24_04850 [Erysipelotrichaceae bacterium]|nr:hypothetical protein [Erysipelotrichaceae bacterium]
MVKKTALVFAAAVLMLSACGTEQKESGIIPDTGNKEPQEAVAIFPKTDIALVGDTMPFYDNGVMNIFYLADQRDGKTGYHPWALFRTQDYCTYEDAGIVLPYGETAEDQDIALGTGCVIKDQNGKYHAFFTGHNDYRSPMEAVMHAVSDDMMNWEKIPGDTFIANEKYSLNDFRDPYVFWVPEENQYWMLIVTRSEGSGVIARYTSKDLSSWTDQGIFFEDDMGYGTNMECPTLLQYGGKWYLSFSDQWPDRVVHYRISDSRNGPFTKPEQDTFDGSGFYAGRMETDGENLYIVGWNGTKIGHDDENDYDWAGNAVIHQLEQHSDGTLVPIVNRKVAEKMNHELKIAPEKMTESVKKLSDGYQFGGNLYELVQFEAFDESGRIEADISGYEDDDMFGIAFAPDIENVGALNFVFNIPENRIEFYNTDALIDNDAQSYVDYDFKGKDSLHMNVFVYGGVACLYLDDEVALTARMYRSSGTNWQFFGINSPVEWDNVNIYN